MVNVYLSGAREYFGLCDSPEVVQTGHSGPYMLKALTAQT